MAVGGRGIRVEVNDAALRDLITSPTGPVAIALSKAGEVVTQGAKRRAPVSPHGSHGRPSGYLRSSIGWELRTESGLRARVGSFAITNDGRNFDYGYAQEVGTQKMRAQPYLRPALDDLSGRRF